MVKLTKEDENKLGQILKELKEVGEMLKGGEGSGVKGHKTPEREYEGFVDNRMSGGTMSSEDYRRRGLSDPNYDEERSGRYERER